MRELRDRMIKVVFFSVVGVFLLIACILYALISMHNICQADQMTRIICENNGIVPPWENDRDDEDYYPMGFNEESPYRTRYFVVYMDPDGRAVRTNMEFIAAISREDALVMAEHVIQTGSVVGSEGKYRYRVSYAGDTAEYIVFLDYSENRQILQVFLMIMAVVFVGFTLLISAIMVFCSKFVLKPFEENSRRQKQFITDASHELKTPLAIISANAEVLEYKNGRNEWTQAIRTETKHMGDLIGDLLVLSKLEEMEGTFRMEQVDFSAITQEAAEKFQEVIAQKQCSLELKIQPGINVNGNRGQLQQLVSILVENAAKYVTEQGRIVIELHTASRCVNLKIFNTAEMEENFDCSRLFERFYRADSSHSSSTGGHGIGLSIAKRIVDCHRGRIRACEKEDGIQFSVSIPTDLKITCQK